MANIKDKSPGELLEDMAAFWDLLGENRDDELVVGNTRLIHYLVDNGFFTAPASTKYHGAYPGGLYEHSRAVFFRLHELTIRNNLKWERPESPFIVGMFHDLCKCDQYVKVKNLDLEAKDAFPTYEYNQHMLLQGHGAKSVMILSQFMTLTEEEMLCIRYHMGAYEREDLQEFDLAIKRWPNTLWSHMSDMLAAKVDGI